MNLIKTKLIQAKGYIQKAHQGLKIYLEANTVTNWYLGSQKPVRSGWYERNWENNSSDRRGILSGWYDIEKEKWSVQLPYRFDLPSAYQELPWRGMTFKGFVLKCIKVIK